MSAQESQSADSVRDPRLYFAAERTFLAWIRTGLALMGFGFVVARFALLMREVSPNVPVPKTSSISSSHVGIGLVVIGIVVNITSTLDYLSSIRRLDRGEVLNRPSKLAIGLSLGLAVLGCFLIANLLAIP